MQTIQLTARYKNLNPGEFAGFEPGEAKHLLESTVEVTDPITKKTKRVPVGKPAVNCRVTKAFTHKDAARLCEERIIHLEERYHQEGAIIEAGESIVLLEEHAEKLQAAGLVEPLVAIRYRKDIDTGDGVIEKGTEKNVSPAEAAKLEKSEVAKVLPKAAKKK